MIPKIIHYCWFGHNPLPELAVRCIESWRKFLPDYEIKVWNEDNFDVNMVSYTKEAYAQKKYAFVSDYARFWILYNFGGLYFDTDVEIIKPMDAVIDRGPFMGCEQDYMPTPNGTIARGNGVAVNPGLGIGAEAGLPLYKEILDNYTKIQFLHADGSLNLKTVVAYTTELLISKGLEVKSDTQCVEGIYIYPKEYFGPKDYLTNEVNVTENTLTIHHYNASWRDQSIWSRMYEGFKNGFLLRCMPAGVVNKILQLKERKRETGSYFN
ncbi:MAG: glycosyl transferase [Paludibacteraceae bacterium]|nr:glycosyl transferase [Paludibacteraceae bacterium]